MDELEKQLKEDSLAAVHSLRFIDDTLMKVAFRDNIPLAEYVLRIILDDPGLRVVQSNSEFDLTRPDGGRSVCLDVLAVDEDGTLYDLEIQRDDRRASPRRARYHSAVLDIESLSKGEDFDSLHESYIIFITENDCLGKGRLMHRFERLDTDSGDPFGDGTHILYLNSSYSRPGDTSDLAMLMHDFLCRDPDDVYHEIIAQNLRNYTQTEKGEKTMCKVVEDVAERYSQRKCDMLQMEIAKGMLEDNDMTYEQIAKYSRLPIETVEDIAREMEKEQSNL